MKEEEETGFAQIKQLNEEIEERRFVSLNDAIVRAGKDPAVVNKKVSVQKAIIKTIGQSV